MGHGSFKVTQERQSFLLEKMFPRRILVGARQPLKNTMIPLPESDFTNWTNLG